MNLNRLFETVKRLEREVAELKRWREASEAVEITPEQRAIIEHNAENAAAVVQRARARRG